MINQGIDNLYKQLETGDEEHECQQPVNFDLDQNSAFEEVTLGPPSIIIDADFSNVKSVRLRLKMKSGKAKIFNWLGRKKGFKLDGETMKLKIEDWTVTVPVDVGKSFQHWPLTGDGLTLL